MNKDDIYKIIGYQGEYTNSVKKAIRKLLKDNHPDNKGNKDIFELINEVKNELENNKVPLKYHKKTINKNKKIDDIDYEYCQKMIDSLVVQKNSYTNSYNKYKKELSILEDEYYKIYRKSIDLELNLLSSSEEVKKIQNIKILSIIMVIIISIIFILSIIKYNIWLLLLFAILTIVCVIVIEKYFVLVNVMTKNNKKRLKEYVLVNKDIRENNSKQEELKNKIINVSKKIVSIENDLRFYNNLLK